jgi:GH24 family phage-related lysozyme (muramidase)
MHASVRDHWSLFNTPFESRVPYMYLDIKGFVTTGVGNLIDASTRELSPPTPAERETSLRITRAMAWLRNGAGVPANAAEVDLEWDAVKSRMDLALRGGGHFAPPVTKLHISDDEIDRIVSEKLEQMESVLKSRAEFADFERWPADAQLALLSMSWGMGPRFTFPKFQAFAAQRDWTGASSECRFKPETGTIIQRNNLNQQCFLNAARVDLEGLDPEALLIGNVAPAPADPAVALDLGTIAGIQAALTALGYSPGPVDGISGPQTIAAVQRFQTDHGLASDGLVGPNTRAALAAALD